MVQGNEWQAPDTAQYDALFIIMAAHLMPRFPPYYVVYQTEQWGHHVLAKGNRVWGPQHNGTERTDFAEVFRHAVEAWAPALSPFENKNVSGRCCLLMGCLQGHVPCQHIGAEQRTKQVMLERPAYQLRHGEWGAHATPFRAL